MVTSPIMHLRHRSQGSIYLLTLIALAIVSAGSVEALALYSAAVRSQRISELNWRGEQFRKAIGSYYESSPESVRSFPKDVAVLMQDPRYLSVRRHIREIYPSPFGEADWEWLQTPDGQIRGVRSRTTSAEFVYKPTS